MNSVKFYSLAFSIVGFASFLPEITSAQSDSIAPDQTNMSTKSSLDFMKEIRIGWNVGNTLEAIDSSTAGWVPGETKWGNPRITQQLIDSVKAAGFNAIRLPVAWSLFSNKTTWTIQKSWLDRVDTVVNYALGRGMYVLLNEHWDGGRYNGQLGGWLQPTNASKDSCTKRLAAIWKQVAIRFRDYNDHLMFAGTNEVMFEKNYDPPTSEWLSVQQSYLQTFVNTVRSTGGRNAYRYLVVQTFNTDINHASSFKLPTDKVSNRLAVEVHYYDPYEFTLTSGNSVTQWGASAPASKKATWDSDESHADTQFGKLKSLFISKGTPVILGEYSAIFKNNTDNPQFRMAWDKYITQAAVKIGAIPFYWDAGHTTIGGSGLFDRSTGKPVHSDVIKAMMSVAPPVASALHSPKRRIGMTRAGNVLISTQGTIRLLNIQGGLIRSSTLTTTGAELSLLGIKPGIFVAKNDEEARPIVIR
jgi:endoglucanase